LIDRLTGASPIDRHQLPNPSITPFPNYPITQFPGCTVFIWNGTLLVIPWDDRRPLVIAGRRRLAIAIFLIAGWSKL
jgi:hypothetical protein